jgi:hypothetical protein
MHRQNGRRAPSLRVGVTLSAVVTALAVAACGSSSGAPSSGSSSASSLLTQTFSGGHSVKSGVLDFTLSLNPSGSSTLTTPISFSLGGPFQSRGTGKLPASDFTIAISALGRHGSLGVISTGTSGFITLEGAGYQLPAADFQRLESSFSSVESSGRKQSGLAGYGINPEHWLKNPSIVGTATVSGAATTHIRAGVNVTALLSDLNTVLAKAAKTATTSATTKIPSSIPAATQQKIGAAIKNATVDVWTGTSDKTLRRLSLHLTVPVTGQGSTLMGGLRSAGIGLTLQYSDLNQPQTIATPTNVKPYSQFTAKLQSVVQALEGSVGGAGGAGSGSGSATSTAGGSRRLNKYTTCIQSAGQDVAKMQKCASLLNGGG